MTAPSKSTKKPAKKPNCPNFSSGPCAKRPGWSFGGLKNALLGRSHRSGAGKKRLAALLDQTRDLLGLPEGYHIGIVPASDTGAVEMALWSLLGERGVDVMAWESFGTDWLKDITTQLKLDDVRTFTAEYGEIVDLSAVDTDRDVVFTWNGTTSGVRVPNGDWIKGERQGLTICDATSAVYAYDLPWDKLDVVTWSWQKVLGGEAAHGMLVLSPRAVERLESYTPPWPLPKIFRMTKDGKLNAGIFKGLTINTPSMLAVEDCLDSLRWVESIGGVSATIKRCAGNYQAVSDWVAKTDWIAFLPDDPAVHSHTSICLKVTDSWFDSLSNDDKMGFIQSMCKLLEDEGVAYDIKSYRAAPAGLRIWGGATVEASDIQALTEWLDWAFALCRAEAQQKAA